MTGRKNATQKFASNGKCYQILSRQSGKAIGVDEDGTLLIMCTPDPSALSQSWKLETAEDGFCRIFNTASGKAVDVINGGTGNGAWLHQWPPCDADSQLWKLEPASSRGCYRFLSKASGKCMDIVDISSEEGAHLQIWDSLDGENQEWKLVAITDGAEAPKATAPKRRRSSTRRNTRQTTAPAKANRALKQPAAESTATLKPEKTE
ncbi:MULTISPECIES: RICIN domain-containing protein [Caproicibacterium]|uniref:RICIN domain-containing protein n=1 Tax=Caproicibacterium argilliputei TaxID=3030016 RepID=A0AA97H070_9FIRM|nr:RICIN domain-containing protein [Caproicibacterium argilliputei]WOC31246.1 RICIN domain-containing protein [Caproicibacterium argilliputei]